MPIIKYQDERLPPSRYAIIRWFGFDQFVPEQAVTSYWVSSKTFFIIRFILTLYSTIVFWTYLGLLATYANFSGFFAAFTTLTFIGLHAYLVTATVYHFRYLLSKNVGFILKQASFLNYLYVYLYSTIMTFNILTPVVYWSILNAGHTTTSQVVIWLNVSVHGVSFFLMIIDVIFNRMRLPIRMVLFVFFTVVFYMFLTFIIYATTNTWVYPFLNWDQGPSTAIWYFMVAIVVVVAFFVMVLIHLLRDWIARRSGRLEVAVADEKVQRSEEHNQQVENHRDMTKVETNRSSANV